MCIIVLCEQCLLIGIKVIRIVQVFILFVAELYVFHEFPQWHVLLSICTHALPQPQQYLFTCQLFHFGGGTYKAAVKVHLAFRKMFVCPQVIL